MTPEAAEKEKISTYLRSLGAYVFRPVQRGMGTATVDLLVCLHGRFIAIEVKVKPEKPTKRQKIVLDQIKAADGCTLVAYSVDDVEEFLELFFGG